MTDVNTILHTQLPVKGKHLLTSNGVVKLPDDNKDLVTILTIINMVEDVKKQMTALAKVIADWDDVATHAEKYAAKPAEEEAGGGC